MNDSEAIGGNPLHAKGRVPQSSRTKTTASTAVAVRSPRRRQNTRSPHSSSPAFATPAHERTASGVSPVIRETRASSNVYGVK